MRTRITSVIFKSQESAPGGGPNESPTTRLGASATLRLEFDDIGVVATVLRDGAPVESDLNPARYPWGVVRKVTGERAVVAEAPRKGRGKLDVALPAEVE